MCIAIYLGLCRILEFVCIWQTKSFDRVEIKQHFLCIYGQYKMIIRQII